MLVLDGHFAEFPFPSEGHVYSYGTAGFRSRADLLPRAIFTTGVIAGLRSVVTGKVIGVMVTASHNPVADNGVKVVDPLGEMMASEWEILAAKLANARNQDAFSAVVKEALGGFPLTSLNPGTVVVGRDTRPSGPELMKALAKGIQTALAHVIDYGIVTTPQLHQMVRSRNLPHSPPATETGYIHNLVNHFLLLTADSTLPPASRAVVVDGANGVGGPKLDLLSHVIGKRTWSLETVCVGDGKAAPGMSNILNDGCGADHVKTKQQPPTGLVLEEGKRYASVDGDADRLVYYYAEKGTGKFVLCDGDKIACLIAAFMKQALDILQLPLTLGVVQTAYANGASTAFLRDSLKVQTAFTCTGVKHLHHKAVEYDIGVYFEANGHGTVVFSSRVPDFLSHYSPRSSLEHLTLRRLTSLTQLINQATGDALSDLLCVEAVLSVMGITIEQWAGLYTDLPNVLEKCVVKDRNLIVTENADTVVVKPLGLQEKINSIVAKYPNGRSFVRPSGTEDVVRIYAEADTQQDALSLAKEVKDLVSASLG